MKTDRMKDWVIVKRMIFLFNFLIFTISYIVIINSASSRPVEALSRIQLRCANLIVSRRRVRVYHKVTYGMYYTDVYTRDRSRREHGCEKVRGPNKPARVLSPILGLEQNEIRKI